MFVVALWLLGCGDDGDGAPFEAKLSDCGSSLDALFGAAGDTQPSLDASYSQALAAWPPDGPGCGLGVLSGTCADGKHLLYRNGGFGSEIRYYDGERFVGYVHSGDIGFCPSVCPFSHFFGALDDVRCEAPSFEDLCAGSSVVLDGVVTMPFANGKAPGGCDE
ncbi:MAG TPA: hypothetical protein VMG12_41745 [Polyangiaceae bacterium]|nr:hypothetical protein [Polyangiaceae bacterium]